MSWAFGGDSLTSRAAWRDECSGPGSEKASLLGEEESALGEMLCPPGEVRIDVSPDDPRVSPPPSAPSASSSSASLAEKGREGKFPKEPHKLLVALLSMATAAAANDVVLAWVHERVQHGDPLPDIAFDHLPYRPEALAVSEYIIITVTATTFLLCLCHKHRWILFRRLFFIASLLYFGRCVTMSVTQLPVADRNYYCAPRLNATDMGAIVLRGLRVLTGLGMSMAGKHTLCGDYVYSGHTICLMLGYLLISEYSPRKWWPIHWAFFLACMGGILSLLLSRGHYSLDCILAYYVTTRLFWLYHTMANHPQLKEASPANHLSRAWWFGFFRWMEGGVEGTVPRRFESPLPWPPRLPRLLGSLTAKARPYKP